MSLGKSVHSFFFIEIRNQPKQKVPENQKYPKYLFVLKISINIFFGAILLRDS
jgi:hypothetical protein